MFKLSLCKNSIDTWERLRKVMEKRNIGKWGLTGMNVEHIVARVCDDRISNETWRWLLTKTKISVGNSEIPTLLRGKVHFPTNFQRGKVH